ncbi:malto-oligosyltrehalose synthase [Ancylobacter sp. WKF20]|uniref:malto-oligosyltrehalose synthase n=1 Tax=Ancylobacter sp. WKF20 TaxID=3039801 RepID=UPI0024344691|nr:malto-oligosyltrehalose synthase [Ancylobacter sp. WKF20]WGD29805.1 malto-oligosyltrehalose synthase [Ancylobacter sp. WKF20]
MTMTPAPMPSLSATYRLQFHRDFPFSKAEALVPYLARLGISHLYASPITLAVAGSTHGYDVADPTRVNPELGGEDGLLSLCAALKRHGMGLIIDIVPNHMAASTQNPFWLNMLEGGPDSPAARIFDVAWDKGRLVLPVLGDPLQATIEAGQITLAVNEARGGIDVVVYGEQRFPLRQESIAELVARLPAAVHIAAAAESPDTSDRSANALDRLASSSTTLHSSSTRFQGGRIDLSGLDPVTRLAFDTVLAEADITSLLEAQHWRLAWWRTAAHDLNYRRFFNITDLAGVRVEDPEVFELVHRLPLDLVRRGLVHGLRVDHIDGLVDPATYCDRLRKAVGPDVLIVIEKILEPGESLRDWPIDGTTGYERLNDINGLFVASEGYAAFEEALRERHLVTGTATTRLASAKKQVLEASLSTEVETLTTLARDGLDTEMKAGDLTETAIRNAVVALLVHCPVYRSYATDDYSPEDSAIWQKIGAAVAAAEDPLTTAAAQVLLDRMAAPQNDSDRQFRVRFQQLGGPAMAKGYEDTELYRTPILLSVNEVGSSLDHPARSPQEVHAIFTARAVEKRRDLNPLATHDTKRGPDTRARLDALSQRPSLWLNFLATQEPVLGNLVVTEDGRVMPDAIDQVLILQTLLSAWPISPERMDGYLTKALREAKRHSNWETPDEAYEGAAKAFSAAILTEERGAPVRQALEALVEALAPATRLVSLAQTALQLTLPGTPDIYQGTEFRDFSLVDPDNRRPVDWERRSAALEAGARDESDADAEKLVFSHLLLNLRRANRALTEGDYRPLDLPASDWGWFGFERRQGDQAVRVIVPTRLPPEAADALALPAPAEPGWRTLEGMALEPGTAPIPRDALYPLVILHKG